MTDLISVFANAAPLQKLVLLILIASLPACIALAAAEYRRPAGRRSGSPLLAALAVGGPTLGLLVGAMNAFHMMDTTLRLAVSPTAKALAPGVMEVAALVGFGAASGLLAVILNLVLRNRRAAQGA